ARAGPLSAPPRAEGGGGGADNKRIFRKLLALGDDGACADDGTAADRCTVHDDRAHADETIIFQRAAVQDDVVADGDVLADGERVTGVGVTGRIVLNVGALAELDPLIIATQDRAEPDGGRLQEAHLADHDGSVGNEIASVLRKVGPLPVELVDRHQCLPFAGDISMPIKAFSSEACPALDAGWAPVRVKKTRLPKSQASTPAARRVIRKNVPDIRLQKPAMMV